MKRGHAFLGGWVWEEKHWLKTGEIANMAYLCYTLAYFKRGA